MATVHITDMKDTSAYIVMMKDGEVVAGVYRCPTCKGEGRGWNRIDELETCSTCGGSGLVSEQVYRRLTSSPPTPPTTA